MQPISVIITTHNRKKLLKRAIESVLNQTYQNYEIIVVDDGSTDDTADLEILKNEKIRYIKQKNKGTSAAKNTGIKNSNFDLIAFLDSDDTWEKEKLTLQQKFMEENPNIYISYTDETWIRNNKKVNQAKKHSKEAEDIFTQSLKNCFIGVSTVMIRKDLFNKTESFDEKMPVCEDYDLWLRISSNHKIAFLPQNLTTKYALPHPQLSFSDYPMEKYRIMALKKIIRTKTLNSTQYYNVLEVLAQKMKIFAQGAKKRKKIILFFKLNLGLIYIKMKIYLFFCKKDLS